MNKLIFILLFPVAQEVWSQDSFIQFDKSAYNQGDTISISCNLPSYKKNGTHVATLYLFIENTDTKQKWNYRFPVLEGISNMDLFIDSSLSEGHYAFNFQVRKIFFSVSGNVKNMANGQLSYIMRTKNEKSLFEKFKTDKNGNFLLNNLLFEDTCYFTFSPVKKNNQDQLTITLKTPLDSAFISDTSFIKIINVGQNIKPVEKESSYHFDQQRFLKKGTLPDVIVTGQYRRKIDQFNAQYSTGLFSSLSAQIFDGLEDNAIASNQNIFQFLDGRIANMKIVFKNGEYTIQWRKEVSLNKKDADLSNVDVFLDERLIDKVTPGFINSSEVAMIKLIPPPAYLTSGGGNGAIAIYTRREIGNGGRINKNTFRVFGYSPLVAKWK